ncbi:MAG: hypothetical protein R3Y43_06680 [Alphaproteobacteria bacterium]
MAQTQVMLRVLRTRLSLNQDGSSRKIQEVENISYTDRHRLREINGIVAIVLNGKPYAYFEEGNPKEYPKDDNHLWFIPTQSEVDFFNSNAKLFQETIEAIREVQPMFRWRGRTLYTLKKELFVRVRVTENGITFNKDVRIKELTTEMQIIGIARGNQVYIKSNGYPKVQVSPDKICKLATDHDLKVITRNQEYFDDFVAQIKTVKPDFWLQEGDIYVASPEFGFGIDW